VVGRFHLDDRANQLGPKQVTRRVLLHERVDRLGRAGAERDGTALVAQTLDGRAADAARPAGDESGLPRQLEVQPVLLCRRRAVPGARLTSVDEELLT